MKHKKQNNDYKIYKDKFLDRDERRKLLKNTQERAELDLLKGRRTWVVRWMLVDLAVFSGLRVAEIAALKVGDLYLKGKVPYITVRNGKGNKKRDVEIDSHLKKHLQKFIRHKKHWHESIEPEAPLFAGHNDNHVKPMTLMKSFKRATEDAGLISGYNDNGEPVYYSIHSARHTYATFLLHDTLDLNYVKEQLGHANIAMTSLYSGILPEDRGKANMISRD